MKNIETNITTLTKEALELLCSELNGAKEEENAAEVAARIEKIEQAVKDYNAAEQKSRVDQILLVMEADKAAAFTDFINNPFYKGLWFKDDKGSHVILDAEKFISFYVLDDAYRNSRGAVNADGGVTVNKNDTLAQSVRYFGFLSLFTHNVASYLAGELSSKENRVTVPSMTAEIEKPKEIDFGKVSVTGLTEQLNAIAATILPAELPVKMLTHDVKAILLAATSEKRLTFTVKQEKAICNAIFAALRVRLNNESYTMLSKAGVHKAK